MFQRTGPKAFKKDLKNIKALLELLDQPHEHFKSIHIAGTNGKGSSSHMLASILQEAGLTVGLYTSPHYLDFRERVKINGEMISKKELVNFVNRVKDFSLKLKPSFFEISVALAFDCFAKNRVDIAVIETGLGGRLDSTNVVDPLISLITNIGWDHTQFLGNSLKKIAKEKAGIIKMKRALVIGEYQREVANVFKTKAKQKKATISFASLKFQAKTEDTPKGMKIILKKRSDPYMPSFHTSFKNPYLSKNLPGVIECISILNQLDEFGHTITKRDIKKGLQALPSSTGYIGRWQVLQNSPLIIADSCHNKEAWLKTLEYLKIYDHRKWHIVLGMVGDKDQSEVLKLLPKNASYYFCAAQIPRAMKAENLQLQASIHNLIGNHYKSVINALSDAKKISQSKDLILIAGSVYVIAEVI